MNKVLISGDMIFFALLSIITVLITSRWCKGDKLIKNMEKCDFKISYSPELISFEKSNNFYL